MTPRRFLALDPSTMTGWTRGTSLEDMTSGTIDLREHANDGRKLVVLERKLERLIGFDESDRVTDVLFEPAFASGNQTDKTLFYICGQIEKIADQLGVGCWSVPAQHWRSKFLGPEWAQPPRRKRTKREKAEWRQELKDAAVRRCELIGHPVANDHEAEATGVFFAGVLKWAPPGFRLPAAFMGPLFEAAE